jgi:hypothetical protein
MTMHLMKCHNQNCLSNMMKIEIRLNCYSCEHTEEREVIEHSLDGNASKRTSIENICEFTDEPFENQGCYLVLCSDCGRFVEQILGE